eukprot:462425_1
MLLFILVYITSVWIDKNITKNNSIYYKSSRYAISLLSDDSAFNVVIKSNYINGIYDDITSIDSNIQHNVLINENGTNNNKMALFNLINGSTLTKTQTNFYHSTSTIWNESFGSTLTDISSMTTSSVQIIAGDGDKTYGSIIVYNSSSILFSFENYEINSNANIISHNSNANIIFQILVINSLSTSNITREDRKS